MWATLSETEERFLDTTFEREELEYLTKYGFVPRATASGRLDDGTEFCFMRFVYADGTVEEREFMHPEALRDAVSFVAAMEESAARNAEADRLGVHPLEITLAPFGPDPSPRPARVATP